MAEGAVDRLLSTWSFHLWLHLDSSCLPFPITFVFPLNNVLFGRKTVNSPSCLSSHQQASCLGAYLGPPGIWWETVLGNPWWQAQRRITQGWWKEPWKGGLHPTLLFHLAAQHLARVVPCCVAAAGLRGMAGTKGLSAGCCLQVPVLTQSSADRTEVKSEYPDDGNEGCTCKPSVAPRMY